MKTVASVVLLLSLVVTGYGSSVALAGPGPEKNKDNQKKQLRQNDATVIEMEDDDSPSEPSRPCGCGGACNHDVLVDVRLPQFFFPEQGEQVQMFWSENLVLVPGYRNLYQKRQKTNTEQLVSLLEQSFGFVTEITGGLLQLGVRAVAETLAECLRCLDHRAAVEPELPLRLATYRYIKAPRSGVLIPARVCHEQLARLLAWALSKGSLQLNAEQIQDLMEKLKLLSGTSVHDALTSWTSEDELESTMVSPNELEAYLGNPVTNQMVLVSNHDSTAVFALVHDPELNRPVYTVMPSSTSRLLFFYSWQEFVDLLLLENSHYYGDSSPPSNSGWVFFDFGSVRKLRSQGLGDIDYDETYANYSEDEDEDEDEEEETKPRQRKEPD